MIRLLATPIEYPSAGAWVATQRWNTIPPAPTRLLMTIGSPEYSWNFCATRRAVTSIPPPAGWPRLNSMARLGKSAGFIALSFALTSGDWAHVAAAARVRTTAAAYW